MKLTKRKHFVEQFNDEQLMLKVKNGDLDALAPLFERYHVKLYNFFLRLTRNKEASQDLTQNVFRRVLSYRESFSGEWKFRSWMYQIARNVHVNYYNKNKVKISDYHDPEQIEQDNTNAIETMEHETKKEALYEALKQLTPEQREILELSKFQGLKYQEISEITGNSISAIKVKVHRAINRLRELYFELV